MTELFRKKILQEAWWKQNDYSKSLKPTDKMPIAEIVKMYESGFVVCDICGKKIELDGSNYTVLDHILHIINSSILWFCDGCVLECKRKGQFIGECESNIYKKPYTYDVSSKELK